MFGGKQTETDAQIAAKKALATLLKKLDVKSAEAMYAALTAQDMLANLADTMRKSFGRPDTLYLDPHTLAAFRKQFSGNSSKGSNAKLGKKNKKS